ncbi:hypothetical protein BWQ96_10748 [Gracilariopsis chorda]|uniref:Uncharacterized protein n=1 Tax=Gracilariopsis chorda TaxID=448386 RepID=A0A2V3IBS8_9FLOR|nr:hypothetical protein BWQ96_10748 [Gracilariopsis chorda]|eukprot:PXF39554.1 hypothetical protein BWQ96_10748 [Gracilariopsis chorda]
MDAVSFEEFKSVHDLPHEYDAATPQHNLRRRSTEAVTLRSVGDMKLRIRPQLRKKSSRKKLSKMSNLCFRSSKGPTSTHIIQPVSDVEPEAHSLCLRSSAEFCSIETINLVSDVELETERVRDSVEHVTEMESGTQSDSDVIDLVSEGESETSTGVKGEDCGGEPSNGNGNVTSRTEAAWRFRIKALKKKNPRIFDNKEARMEIRTKAKQGHTVYMGIGVDTSNCDGLRSVMDFVCCPEFNLNPSERWKKELRTTVSQFLRWCVANSACHKYDVWKRSALFENVSNKTLVETFLGYFLERCSTRTFYSKAEQLSAICEAARPTLNESQRGKLGEVIAILDSVGHRTRAVAFTKL